jgi:aldose 1-epimerase
MKLNCISVALSMCMALFAACNSSTKATITDSDKVAAVPSKSGFDTTINGKKISLYVLKNSKRMQAAFTNYGGRLVSLLVPDKNGKLTDVADGFKSVAGYQNSTEPYFGATIGRYDNRIAKGKFMLNGKSVTLTINNGPNTLHGGKAGFQNVVFDAVQSNDSTVQFSYLSKDMEGGFPGNVNVKVTYSLVNDELHMDYEATTDKPTVVNLTNHAFFNLNGEGSGTILNHQVWIYADKYTPVDSTLIPTGKLEDVAGTPFDFNHNAHTIGERINQNNAQLKNGKGYDHNFVLLPHAPDKFIRAATVTGDKSGVVMDVFTQEPGLQFYSGNFMQSKNALKDGSKDDFRTAFAMETQHFPDSPNQPSFPSTVLKPGQLYKTSSYYKFSVKK